MRLRFRQTFLGQCRLKIPHSFLCTALCQHTSLEPSLRDKRRSKSPRSRRLRDTFPRTSILSRAIPCTAQSTCSTSFLPRFAFILPPPIIYRILPPSQRLPAPPTPRPHPPPRQQPAQLHPHENHSIVHGVGLCGAELQ